MEKQNVLLSDAGSMSSSLGEKIKPLEESLIPEIDYMVYRECTPSWRIDDDFFYFWDVTYVTYGSAKYIIDGKEYVLNAGDILCLPPDHVRKAKTLSDRLMHCFAVNFALKNSKGKDASLPFPLISHIGVREDLIHMYNELNFAWIDRQPGSMIKIQALFLLILYRLYELMADTIDVTSIDFRVNKVIRYIVSHFSEKITVKKMAELVDLTSVYFGTLFKREVGLSMNRYLIKIRIKKAENLLRSGEFKVSEAAEQCGYDDTFYFYKHFKEICGIAPSECIPKKKHY